MANLSTGPMYSEIGRLVAQSVRGKPEGAFLYAQVGDGWSSDSIYEDVGDRVYLRQADLQLGMLLMDLWDAEDEDKRWAELHYSILEGSFIAKHIYAEEIDRDEDQLDRRDRIVREKFGDKPIDYSDP